MGGLSQEDIIAWLESRFQITERSSSIGQEARAATATFLTMSYILLVNPQLLSKIGISPTEVVVGTALSSFAGSFLAGYFGYAQNIIHFLLSLDVFLIY